MSARLENAVFNLKFQAKILDREMKRAEKEGNQASTQMKKYLKQKDTESAEIYANMVIQKKSKRLDMLRTKARLDTIISQVQDMQSAQRLAQSMASVTKGIDVASKGLNLEQLSAIMDRFEAQSEDMQTKSQYLESATAPASARQIDDGAVKALMAQTADEIGVEVGQELNTATPSQVKTGPTEVEEDGLGDRLRALRA